MLNNLPLIDLHRHLDGNIRPKTILELGNKFDVVLPATDLEGLIPHIQAVQNEPSLMAFLPKLEWGVSVLGDLDACRRVAYENVEDLVNEHIDYAELRFSPYFMAKAHNLPLEGVVEAVIDGVSKASKDFAIPVKLIGIMSRTFGQEKCFNELNAILANKDHFIAVDLAGDEVGYPGDLFLSHFDKVRDAGLHVTVHAGEALGAESIWQAIRMLGAQRIGHAVNAVQDPVLMDYIRDHKIGIESCLTSNVQTTTVQGYPTHPVKQFLEHGIMVCINSDDPAVHGVDLSYEYKVATQAVGLSKLQIKQLQLNAIEMAFLTDVERKNLLLRKE